MEMNAASPLVNMLDAKFFHEPPFTSGSKKYFSAWRSDFRLERKKVKKEGLYGWESILYKKNFQDLQSWKVINLRFAK